MPARPSISTVIRFLAVLTLLSAPWTLARASHCASSEVSCYTRYPWSKTKAGSTTYSAWTKGVGDGGSIFWSRVCSSERYRTRTVVHVCCADGWDWFWASGCGNKQSWTEKELLDPVARNQISTKCTSSIAPSIALTRPVVDDFGAGLDVLVSSPMAKMAADVWGATDWPEDVLTALTYDDVYAIMAPGYIAAGFTCVFYGELGLMQPGSTSYAPDFHLMDVGNALVAFGDELALGAPSGLALLAASQALVDLANCPEMADPTLPIYPVVNPIMLQAAAALAEASTRAQTGLLSEDDHRAFLSALEDFTDAMGLYAEAFALEDTFSDCNGNGIDDFIDLTVGGLPDANGNGILDDCEGTGLVTELCSPAGLAFGGAGTPITVQDTIEVEDPLVIADVNALVQISHPFIGDLHIELASPYGTTVVLHDAAGGAAGGLFLIYDDDGVPPGGAPYDSGLAMQPAGPGTLSDLAGVGAGEWTLTVTDLVPDNNDGVLVNWCLTFSDGATSGTPQFRRGDVNDDGSVNIADAIALLTALFGGGFVPACDDAADANDDGGVNIADAIAVLNALFSGGFIPAPNPNCGS
ncbi:MAG: proprotein convertase P-domain-containing protein, partial [Planctomycetes bacterium]|nr:proprotein convertase P-domain-containing protein [Planctomycetota bacterium]